MKKILLSSAVAVLILVGCGEEKKTTAAVEAVVEQKVEKVEEVKQPEPTRIEVVTKAASEAGDIVSKAASDVTDTVSDAASKVAEKTAVVVEETTKEVSEVAKKVNESTSNVVASVKEEATKVMAAVKTEETAPSINVKALFAACAGCHGQNGEKKALGKSAIIKGWDKQKLIDALNGYKDGSYGGPMKGVMKGQVATKSDAEIEALSTFISNL